MLNKQQPPYAGPVSAHSLAFLSDSISGASATGQVNQVHIGQLIPDMQTSDVSRATDKVRHDTGIEKKEQETSSNKGD